MSTSLAMNIFIIVFLVLFVAVLARRSQYNQHYDEMQELARLRGHKYGFYTVVFMLVVWYLVESFADELPIMLANVSIILIILYAGLIVDTFYAILHDAYFDINSQDKWKRFTAIWLVLGILELVTAVLTITSGKPMIENGVLTLGGSLIYFLMGIYFTLFSVLTLIRQRDSSKNDE